MAKFGVNANPAATTRIVNAMVGLFGPVPTDAEGSPTMTDEEFADVTVQNLIQQQVLRWEQSQAQQTAREGVVRLPKEDIPRVREVRVGGLSALSAEDGPDSAPDGGG